MHEALPRGLQKSRGRPMAACARFGMLYLAGRGLTWPLSTASRTSFVVLFSSYLVYRYLGIPLGHRFLDGAFPMPSVGGPSEVEC